MLQNKSPPIKKLSQRERAPGNQAVSLVGSGVYCRRNTQQH